MSARRILGLESVPRVGLFAHQSGTRAGFRTSRDSSVSIRRGRRKIEERHLQYERTEMARPLVRQLGCPPHSWIAMSRRESLQGEWCERGVGEPARLRAPGLGKIEVIMLFGRGASNCVSFCFGKFR